MVGPKLIQIEFKSKNVRDTMCEGIQNIGNILTNAIAKDIMKGTSLGGGMKTFIVSNMPKYAARQIIIPWTDTRNPLYSPTGPSLLTVFARQSIIPWYCRSLSPLPTSAPNL